MCEFNYLIVPLTTRTLTDKDQELITKLQAEHGEERVHSAISSIVDLDLPDTELDLLILLILSGGISRTAAQIQLQVKTPTVVLCHGEDNSLPSALGLLERKLVDVPTLLLVYDRSSVDQTARDIDVIVKACRAAYRTLNAKFAVLFETGVRLEWINLLKKARLRLKFIRNVDLDTSNYENYIRSLEDALMRIIDTHKVAGLTFDCFNLLRRHAMTPCLAFARLLAKGVPVACECDLLSLFSQVLLKELSPDFLKKSMIVNVVDIDSEGSLVTVAHCTAPLTISDRYELDRHFESGYPNGVRAYLPVGARCTLFRIDSDFTTMYISKGTIVKNSADLASLKACLTKAQIKLDSSINGSILGNHHILVLEDKIAEYLKIAAWYLNLKVIGIKFSLVMRSPLLR